MSQYSNICILYYSRFLSSSFVGNLVYPIQIVLFDFGLLNSFFASSKKSVYRRILFRKISQKFTKIYCRSYRFSRELKFLSNQNLILDISPDKRLGDMGKEDLYQLMWSLVFCKSVSLRTKKLLTNFLPTNYPVTNDL